MSTNGETEGRGFRVTDRRWWAQGEDAAAGAPAAQTEDKPSYVAQLERELEAKSHEVDQLRARVHGMATEVDRIKERLEREAARERQRDRRASLRAFLDVIDDVDRAVAAADTAGDAALRDGVELIRRRFLAALRDQGVERFDPFGAPFDPHRHEALASVPVSADDDDGKVVGVIAAGYAIGDDVLRPARVAVGKRDP